MRESLGAFPGSIFKVMSPPTISSCSAVPGEEEVERDSFMMGDWEAVRDLHLGGMLMGVGVGVRSSFSTFSLTTPPPSPAGGDGGEPSLIFMSRSSGSSRALFFSDSLSVMVAGGARVGVSRRLKLGIGDGGQEAFQHSENAKRCRLLHFRDNHGPLRSHKTQAPALLQINV